MSDIRGCFVQALEDGMFQIALSKSVQVDEAIFVLFGTPELTLVCDQHKIVGVRGKAKVLYDWLSGVVSDSATLRGYEEALFSGKTAEK